MRFADCLYGNRLGNKQRRPERHREVGSDSVQERYGGVSFQYAQRRRAGRTVRHFRRPHRKGEGLAYTVTPKYLTINNLSGDDTSDFFHTLDVVLKIGSAEDLNAKIGTTAANALIGTEQNPGFVCALKSVSGSGSFGFASFEKDGKQVNALIF